MIIKWFNIVFIFTVLFNFIFCQNEDSGSLDSSSTFNTLIDVPDEVENIPFLCYGNTNNQSLYLVNNSYIYKPHSVKKENSISYLPSNCSLLHDGSDLRNLSCCLNSNKESFNKAINYIWSDQVIGNLIDLTNNKTLEGGFKIVNDDGTTPDLIEPNKTKNNEDDEQILFVYDTRDSVKTCLDHLVKIQCFRCSQDHRTILRDLDPSIYRLLGVEGKVPLFFLDSETVVEKDIVNGSLVNTNITHGKPLSICKSYFDTLMQHCQYVSARNTPLNKLYVPVSDVHFKSPAVGKYGIKVPYLQEIAYVSIDKVDSFYVSNFNCFQLPIKPFVEPSRSLVINKIWYADKNNQTSESAAPKLESNQILKFILVLIIILIVN
ncbi:hypothetical protein DICPUDRAFT_155370 [Dictyostelium purpureum]|uniref:Uncharacterized protein n=1 Tax=Dictyostelium purpureum TaxID=5786 RepID=F0ZTT7_DICPU|nr:uncharacterized protein DICPUDRAFT_155370 [Dictyostelium purpureum]EGC32651.1 hypothetical protein DICPUDRAFT_155370 [Dictyostelium purpureum]|eukprot:XP_003290820.1 hypothetical protein DICPUDRAFT_155370 [Dictyostelium purpureum]